MRVDQTDIRQLGGHAGPLTNEAIHHLDALFDYLHMGDSGPPAGASGGTADTEAIASAEQPGPEQVTGAVGGAQHLRTDFSDLQELTMAASRVGRLLQICAELHMWAQWARTTSEVVALHGDQATVAHVLHRMTGTLASRALRVTTTPRAGGIALLYGNLVTEQLASAVSTMTRLVDADANVAMLAERIATKRGITVAQVQDALVAGDREIAHVLAQEAIIWTEDQLRARGITPDPALRQFMGDLATGYETAALEPGQSLGPDAATALLGELGVAASSVRQIGPDTFMGGVLTPAMQGHGADQQDHIRVG